MRLPLLALIVGLIWPYRDLGQLQHAQWHDPRYKPLMIGLLVMGIILFNVCGIFLAMSLAKQYGVMKELLPNGAMPPLIVGAVFGALCLLTAPFVYYFKGPRKGLIQTNAGPIDAEQSRRAAPFFMAAMIGAVTTFLTQYFVNQIIVMAMLVITLVLFVMGGLVARGVITLHDQEQHGPSKAARVVVLVILAAISVAGALYVPLSQYDFNREPGYSSTTSFEWRVIDSGSFDESFPMNGIPQEVVWTSREMPLQGSQLNLTFAQNYPMLELDPSMQVTVEFKNQTWSTVFDDQIVGWENIARNGTHWRVSVTFESQYDRNFQLGYEYAQAYRLHCVTPEGGKESCEEWLGHE